MTPGYLEAIYDEGEEDAFEVRIFYAFAKGHPGRSYMRNGDPGYPADPDEIDLDHVEREIAGQWIVVTDTLVLDWAGDYLADHSEKVADDQDGMEQYDRELAADLRDDV